MEHRNSDSDIDFDDDVYGGPPTWTRYSYRGSKVKQWEESTYSPTGSIEKPVFGELYSSTRRRTSDDFIDDVFRRIDKSVGSPRWCSPGLRTLTPAKIETHATSTRADFSLPVKMTRGVDAPVFASNLHAQNTHLSRFSSPTKQSLRNNSGQSPGHTLLSRDSSSVNESLYSTPSTQNEIEKSSKRRTGPEKNDFHFSIYKWANTGVPLLMSTLKGSSKVSALSVNNMQDSGFQNEDLYDMKQDMNPVYGFSLMEVTEKDSLAMKQEVNKLEGMPQSSLLHDETERKGYLEAGTLAGTKEKTEIVSVNKIFKAKKMNSSNKAEENKPGVGSRKIRVKGMVKDFFRMSYNQKSSTKTTTNVSSGWKTKSRKRIKDEVEDIISKFDTNVAIKTYASKATKVASDVPAESVKMTPSALGTRQLDSNVFADTVNVMPDASFMANEESKRSNKQKFTQNRTIRKLEDINFQNDASASPTSKLIANGSKASVETIDDPSFDNFQVKEVTPVGYKLSESQESDAIMALDSKIHMWSSGRTRNIRSLLSTLQLVLWAESGWKPVALIDIIEANAVKRAYNRAMLCLHPDKLQQKGVDSHKKYIAEKVFNILQEAWDHLNSLGGVIP